MHNYVKGFCERYYKGSIEYNLSNSCLLCLVTWALQLSNLKLLFIGVFLFPFFLTFQFVNTKLIELFSPRKCLNHSLQSGNMGSLSHLYQGIPSVESLETLQCYLLYWLRYFCSIKNRCSSLILRQINFTDTMSSHYNNLVLFLNRTISSYAWRLAII